MLELMSMYHEANKLEDSTTSCLAVVTIKVCAVLMPQE